MIPSKQALERAKGAVIRVGAKGGRGFIVSAGEDKDERYVITAAHCLPRSRYPSPRLANSATELTFRNFLGSYRQFLVTGGPVRRRRLRADGRSAWR
jgi:hypothetical protein